MTALLLLACLPPSTGPVRIEVHTAELKIDGVFAGLMVPTGSFPDEASCTSHLEALTRPQAFAVAQWWTPLARPDWGEWHVSPADCVGVLAVYGPDRTTTCMQGRALYVPSDEPLVVYTAQEALWQCDPALGWH